MAIEMAMELAVAVEAAQAAIEAAKARHRKGYSANAEIRYGDLQRLVDDLVIATKREQVTRQYHFEQNEQMVSQIEAMRTALQAVVQHCVPGATPTQMMGYDRPWQLAATALYGLTHPDESRTGAELTHNGQVQGPPSGGPAGT